MKIGNINNSSKLEQKNALLETLKYNDEALDYIDNQIACTENIRKLDETDMLVNERLNTERYIKFSLEYLEKCYTDRLKKLGVKV